MALYDFANKSNDKSKDSKVIDMNTAKNTAPNTAVTTTKTTAVVTTTKKVEIDPELQRQIAMQVVDYKFAPVESLDKPATYVQAKNGMFVIKKTAFGSITVPVKEIPYLPEVQQGVKLDLPKVPYVFFLQAYSFFKDVTTKSKDEAALVLYWNHEKEEYEYLCPEQTVSGAAVKFGEDKDYLLRMIDAKYTRICELHSHNVMSAFHSGTDDHDEVFDCTFLVFGKLDTSKPEHIFSYAASGVRKDSTIWDIFEKPISTINIGGVIIEKTIDEPLYMDVTYPKEDWFDKLSKYVYTSKSYYTTGVGGSKLVSDAGRSLLDEEDDYWEDYYNRAYGYGSYDRSLVGSKDDKEKEKEEEEIEKDVASKMTDRDYLMSKDYVDELNPAMDPEEVIAEMEYMYGSKFLDNLIDMAVKKGYGTAWWENELQ